MLSLSRLYRGGILDFLASWWVFFGGERLQSISGPVQAMGAPASTRSKAKHLVCAFRSGSPGYLTPGNIFPFTHYCPRASVTCLTESPGTG